MKNIELGEKLKNRFKELEALIADELGAEKMETLEKIIWFIDCDDENIFIVHKNEKNEKNLIAIYEKVKENDYKARRIWK